LMRRLRKGNEVLIVGVYATRTELASFSAR
jgi:hypothetical protein